MEKETATIWIVYLENLIRTYAPRVVLAILCLIIGLWLIGRVTKSVKKLMMKKEVDVSLVPFIASIINIGLKILLVISVPLCLVLLPQVL